MINDRSGCWTVATKQLGSEFTPVYARSRRTKMQGQQRQARFSKIASLHKPKMVSQMTQPRPRAVACALSGATRPYRSTDGTETGRALHKHINRLVLYCVLAIQCLGGSTHPNTLGSEPMRCWLWESWRLGFWGAEASDSIDTHTHTHSVDTDLGSCPLLSHANGARQ